VDRHTFQACPVWIHTQSNITSLFVKATDATQYFTELPDSV
jgi:hypothetical protein